MVNADRQTDRQTILAQTWAKKKSLFGSFFSRKSNAFTLAEVLITLGIIGIVSAMTIPTIISVYRKNVAETRLKGFYSEINQAVKLSTVDNGEPTTWTYPNGWYDYDGSEKFFNTYLKNYLHYVKVETYKSSIWPTYGIFVYLNNGSMFHLSGSDDNSGFLWITFYPVASKTSETGRDVFLFASSSFTKGFIQPYGYKTTNKNDLLYGTYLGCASSALNSRRYCSGWIMQNNWKIPDDYPWIK